ncbi:MAG: putative PEP-CTERM system histidine kinase [Halioglobus sp.]|jgi:putative PEP-CTERM system histidine kinase
MVLNVGLLSYAIAALAYLSLALLLAFVWRDRPFKNSLVIACILTALWAGVIAGGTQLNYPPIRFIQLFELLRNAGWAYFLLQVTAMRFDGNSSTIGGRSWRPLFVLGTIGLITALIFVPWALSHYNLAFAVYRDIALGSWLCMAIFGLLLLEQIFRNANNTERWSLKYLCFGLGGIFAFDLLMYSEALMFRQLDSQYWQARGLVNALVTPMLAISFARGSSWKTALNISRQVVFHTVSLLGAGVYLILMAVVGYFIKFLGGSWGGVLQISFLIGTGVLLLVLLFSGQIRAKTRVLLSKHFFAYRYDYREEWLKFTRALSDMDDDVPGGVIRCMATLVESPGGMLWTTTDDKQYRLLEHWEMAEPEKRGGIDELATWLQSTKWVIDLHELQRNPDIYDNLDIPPVLSAIADAWLVLPIMFGDKLPGILLLKDSELQKSLDWEEHDLLKTAGRQAGSHLAQYLASEALVEAKQFDAFNRLSAYVVHDLKNVLAQQSLMVANAEKHKHKPEFVDDMITTVQNSVQRMTSLMEQMRSGMRTTDPSAVELSQLIVQVIASHNIERPLPTLESKVGDIFVHADEERLVTVFGHLVQNAQHATDNSGKVVVRLTSDNQQAIIEIQDTGVGMSPEFVNHRLFKAFESTKGLTGMGIGAFESREFIRSLGGDITVSSTPREGSLFSVSIPCLQTSETD